MTTETEDQKAQKARSERRAEAGKTIADTLKKQKETRAEANAEADRRMSEARPTPTQDENDLAALGAPVAEKEPDGSPPEVKEAVAAGGAAPYRTREAQPKPAPAKKPE